MIKKGIATLLAALALASTSYAEDNQRMEGPEGKPETEEFMNSAEVVNRLNKIHADRLNIDSAKAPQKPKCVRGCNEALTQPIRDFQTLMMDAYIPALMGGGCIQPKDELGCWCRRGRRFRPGQSGYIPFTIFEMSDWGFQTKRVTEMEQKAEQLLKDLPRYGMLPYQGKVAMDNNKNAKKVFSNQDLPYGTVLNPADEVIQKALQDMKQFDYEGDVYRARYNANKQEGRFVYGHAFATPFRNMPIGPVALMTSGDKMLTTHQRKENKRSTSWKFHTDRKGTYFPTHDLEATHNFEDYSEMLELLEENPDLCLKASMERGDAPKDLVELMSDSDDYSACMRYGSFVPFTAMTPTLSSNNRAITATIGVAKTGKLACAMGEDTAPIDLKKDRFMWIQGKGHKTITNYKCTTLDIALQQYKDALQEDPESEPFALVHFRYLRGCPNRWSPVFCSGRVTNEGCGGD